MSVVALAFLILCDPMDCSPPGSSVHGLLQAKILEWVAILFSRGSSWHKGSNPGLLHCRQILYHLSHQGSPINGCKLCACMHTCSLMSDFAIPWTVAHQAFLSMGFSWQKYWSGLPFFFSRGSSWSGSQLKSLVFPSLAGGFFTSWATREALYESRGTIILQVFP